MSFTSFKAANYSSCKLVFCNTQAQKDDEDYVKISAIMQNSYQKSDY